MSKCQWRCDHCDHLYDEHKCGDGCNMFEICGYMDDEGVVYPPGFLTLDSQAKMTPVYKKVVK